MNNLKLILHEGHILYKTARATNHPFTDDIVLYLPNIMKDIENDEDRLWEAIDHLFLIELTCSIITKEINNNKPICKGNGHCPINKVLKKVNLNYKIRIECQKTDINKEDMNQIKFNRQNNGSLITSATLANRLKQLKNEIRN